MLQLDGSYGEGGGAIIRNAIALSLLTGQAFKIANIRQGRPNPGLSAQHLSAVLAAKELCDGEAIGAELGSTELEFRPSGLKARTMAIDIGTAGSITLLLQAILLPCMFGDGRSRLKLTGGTDTKWSIPWDYFREVFLPAIREYADIEIELSRRGYYPEGGGKVELRIAPRYHSKDFTTVAEFRSSVGGKTPKLELLETGKIVWIEGISHAAEALSGSLVAERQAAGARKKLQHLGCNIKLKEEYTASHGLGSGITLWAGFDSGCVIGADALGEKAKRAEAVGEEAAANLIAEIEKGAPVDSHLADQLIPFIGLFGGKIKAAAITPHCMTNIYVFEQFFGKTFTVDKAARIISA
jgi:RNA 3'-terminal phosphate cyclase (GTP)